MIEKLKKFMKENRYTPRLLGEELGVSGSYIRYILNGKRTPSKQLCLKIRDLTKGEITLEDLVTHE